MKAEDRKRYLSRKRTYVLENIAPNEMHIVADIIVNQIKPSEVFPALFDILQSKEPGKIPKGTDDEIMLSYLVTETKTRRVIKQLTPKARKDFLKGLGHDKKETRKKSGVPVRKSRAHAGVSRPGRKTKKA